MISMPLKYITREELAVIMRSGLISHKDYYIIDVRDGDWHGGNITGSLNSPSHGFRVRVAQLVEEMKDVPLLVFHCAMSQFRGPQAAKIFVAARLLSQGDGEDAAHRVMILRGGFSEFEVMFKDDPLLVENSLAELRVA